MPRNCFVLGCPAGTKLAIGKSHHFAPPKDPQLFELWSQACYRQDRQLKMTSKICHRHFREDEIRKETSVQLPDGSTLSAPLSRWQLKSNTVPSIFDNRLPNNTTADHEVHASEIKALECYSGVYEHMDKPIDAELDVKDANTEKTSVCEPMETIIGTEFDVEDVNMCISLENLLRTGSNILLEVDNVTGLVTMRPLESPPVQRSTVNGQSDWNTDGSAQIIPRPNTSQHEEDTRWKDRAKAFETLYKRWKNRYHWVNRKYKRLKLVQKESAQNQRLKCTCQKKL